MKNILIERLRIKRYRTILFHVALALLCMNMKAMPDSACSAYPGKWTHGIAAEEIVAGEKHTAAVEPDIIHLDRRAYINGEKQDGKTMDIFSADVRMSGHPESEEYGHESN